MGSHQLISAHYAQRENLICRNVFKNMRERYLKCCACQVRSGKRKAQKLPCNQATSEEKSRFSTCKAFQMLNLLLGCIKKSIKKEQNSELMHLPCNWNMMEQRANHVFFPKGNDRTGSVPKSSMVSSLFSVRSRQNRQTSVWGLNSIIGWLIEKYSESL